MAISNSTFRHDPRVVSKAIFDEAKSFSGTAFALKVFASGLGIYFVLIKAETSLAPWFLAALAGAAECCDWRSDLLKGRAEDLKRKIEYHDGLGWSLPTSDFSDFLVGLSARKRKTIEASVSENYFASGNTTGPIRAVENLQESAWWSKHLAQTMVVGCSLIAAGLMLVSLGSLAVSISAIKDEASLQNASRIISSAISLIVSLGLARLAAGYFGFSKQSEQTERATIIALSKDDLDSTQAVKLMTEYQIARATAPLIPDWLWRARRDALNELWNEYRKEKPSKVGNETLQSTLAPSD